MPNININKMGNNAIIINLESYNIFVMWFEIHITFARHNVLWMEKKYSGGESRPYLPTNTFKF